MKVKFREVGNSLTITIPKDIVKVLNLKQGMEAEVNMKDNGITVYPIKTTSNISIKSLFKDYNGDYKPNEIDWGEKRGSEIW